MHDKRRVSKHTAITLAATAAIGVLGLFLFTHNKADVDLWGNVGFVKHWPNSPQFHLTNTFSFTEPDHPWVNHEWLAEYIFNRTHLRFGNPGLLILKALLGFTLISILNRSMRENARSGTVRFLLLAIVMSTIGYGFSTRPHLFTYILFAALLKALLQPKPHLILLLVAAPLGCLWANLHGAFFIGQVLLLLATAWALVRHLTKREPSRRNLLILTVASAAFFLGTFWTPYGIRLWSFVSNSAALSRPILSEWAPFNPLTQFSIHIDFILLSCIAVFTMLVSLKRCSGFALLVLVLSLIAALAMRRNIPIFAIVAALVATRYIDETLGWRIDGIIEKLSKQFILALLIIATTVSGIYFGRANRARPLDIVVPRDQLPIEAMAFLERNVVHANALVFFDWAEYFIWKMHPNSRVFLDGRFRSAYSEKAIQTYLNFIYAGSNPWAALNDYPTDLVFVHVGNPCTANMRYLEGWAIAYQDAMAVIFVKRDVHGELLRDLSTRSPLPTEPLSESFP